MNNSFNSKTAVVIAGLQDLFEDDDFNTIDIKQIAKVAGVQIPSDVQDKFDVLHCIHYNKMGSELREWLYTTVMELFGNPEITLGARFMDDVNTPEPEKRGFLPRLLKGVQNV